MHRSVVLTTADELINGQRAEDYGPPEVNFQRIAMLWTPVLGREITPEEVALCLCQLKIARLINTPDHKDSWVDAAGYIAIGGQLATESSECPF